MIALLSTRMFDRFNGTLFVYLQMSTPAILKLFYEAVTYELTFSHKSGMDLMYFLLEHLPKWSSMWFFKLVGLLKPRLQMWHLKGHSPLCTYMWLFRSPGVGNDFEHCEHLCGFSWKSTNIFFSEDRRGPSNLSNSTRYVISM